MENEFDYYGNLIKYTVDFDYDGVSINIISTSKPIEDLAEEKDIEFHCSEDYTNRAWDHFIKTGCHL